MDRDRDRDRDGSREKRCRRQRPGEKICDVEISEFADREKLRRAQRPALEALLHCYGLEYICTLLNGGSGVMFGEIEGNVG